MPRSMWIAAILVVAAPAAGYDAVTPSRGSKSPYHATVSAAMERMMAGMAGPSSGNVDRDFATMMIPHHQGAIDMAVAELRFGRDDRLRRMAQEIIVEQQDEIMAMRLAAAALPRPQTASAARRDHPMPMEH